jgi:hypothetical protein
MPQEDYLESEIRKIAQFLVQSISQINELKPHEQEYQSPEEIKKEILNRYQINLNEIQSKSNEEFVAGIMQNKAFSYMNMEYLSDLIQLMAVSETNPDKQNDCLAKSLAIYLYIDKHQKNYSIERANKIKKIKELMN